MIHRLLRPPSCKHPHSCVLQRTFKALYLLHKALNSGRRHMTFCCSKQLNRTLFTSSLTRPCLTWPVRWDKPGQLFCPHARGCHKSQRILIQICDLISKRRQQLTITDPSMLRCVLSFFGFLRIIIRLIASQTFEFLYRNTNLHCLS